MRLKSYCQNCLFLYQICLSWSSLITKERGIVCISWKVSYRLKYISHGKFGNIWLIKNMASFLYKCFFHNIRVKWRSGTWTGALELCWRYEQQGNSWWLENKINSSFTLAGRFFTQTEKNCLCNFRTRETKVKYSLFFYQCLAPIQNYFFSLVCWCGWGGGRFNFCWVLKF